MNNKRKVLILGGNRFFGKKLAKLCVESGDSVTLLNRGNLDDGFSQKVTRIKCDRNDESTLEKLTEGMFWDVIYDQICYSADQALLTSSVFGSKATKLIHISSQSVYNSGADLKEKDFDPLNYSFEKIIPTTDEHYAEGKRQAEAVLAKHWKSKLVLCRLPIVIGKDDYTKRLKWHIENILNGKSIYFPNREAKISFIHSDDTAQVLYYLGHCHFDGAINLGSGPISLKRMTGIIEGLCRKKGIYSETEESNHSPYGIEEDWFMDYSKMSSLSLRSREIEEVLEQSIKDLL